MEEKEILKDEQITNAAEADTNLASSDSQEKPGQEKEEISIEEKLTKEVAELKEKYLRLYSEFENYRRRTSKEKIDLIKSASQDLMVEILPVVDDFERAFKASETQDDPKEIRDGNQLVFQKLLKTLEGKGLQPMKDLIGQPFDADTQEAITQIPAPREEMKGRVVDVVEKGYLLGDKVIRYAKVVIGA